MDLLTPLIIQEETDTEVLPEVYVDANATLMREVFGCQGLYPGLRSLSEMQ